MGGFLGSRDFLYSRLCLLSCSLDGFFSSLNLSSAVSDPLCSPSFESLISVILFFIYRSSDWFFGHICLFFIALWFLLCLRFFWL